MQAFTIVIKMTGLLLVTPHNPTSGPTHILMPEPAGVESHVAEVGYIGSDCTPDGEGICWVNMDGWAMELGKGLSNSLRPELRDRIGNLTRRLKGALPADHDDPNPEDIRSRVSLYAGRATGFCGVARWKFAKTIDNPGNVERMELTNVLTWTIRNAGQGSLALVRTRMDDQHVETIATVKPDKSKRIELFIRYVPGSSLPRQPGTTNSPPDVGSHVRAAAHQAQFADSGEVATHFTAYYEYLGIDPTAPLPHDGRRIKHLLTGKEKECSWRKGGKAFGVGTHWGVGTLNCMVASADPQ